MPSLLLALLGALTGLVLDRVAVRLAVLPSDDGTQAGQADAASHTGSSSFALGHLRTAGMRAPLVVTATAGLFAAAGARYDEPSHLTLVSVYICVLLLCATTDLLAYRVPNIVTYPAIASAVAGGAFEPDAGLIDVLLGGVVAGGVLFLPALASRGAGMGMGDVKLALFVGLALGLSHVALALVAMALLGGVTAALLLVTRLRRRHEPIPYAPFIAAGGLVALLWQGAAFVDLA